MENSIPPTLYTFLIGMQQNVVLPLRAWPRKRKDIKNLKLNLIF